MTLPFTIQQLKIFKAIVTEESFTKASKILFLSQPSLSKQIKKLENCLDISLINREKNKIKLTEAGKIFLKYSDRILALCEESYRAINELKIGNRGNLKIGTSETIGTYIMPKILTLFAQKYPQINLQVQVDSTRIITKNISDGLIDIGIVGGNISKELKKKLEIESFIEDEFILILPKYHPLALINNKKIGKEQLYHLNFITLDSNSTMQKLINQTLINNNIKTKQFNIIMQLNSIEAIKTAVSLGLGAAFISLSAVEKEIELETIEILRIEEIKITRTVSIITSPYYSYTKSIEFFYTELYKLKNNL